MSFHPADIDPEVVAVSIPVISVLGGVFIAIVAIVMGARKKELLHKERLIAMEKGLELPAIDPPRPRREAYRANRTGGLVMTFLGIGLTIAIWTSAGAEGGVWGLIPLAIGIGLLVSAHIEKKEVERNGNGAPVQH